MDSARKKLKFHFIYPILFAIFPILALWASNFGRVQPNFVVRPLIFSIFASILLYLLCWLVLRNLSKAALMSTLVIFLFFTYGHVYGLLENRLFFGLLIGRHRTLIFLWLLLFGVGTFLILKHGAKALGLNQFLNTVGIILFVLSVVQLVYFQFRFSSKVANYEASQGSLALVNPGMKVDLLNSPDVYLIVLDAYMRADVLQRDYNFDNNTFLKQLADLGFVIPPCTQSNYSYTILSLTSILNMNYLDALDVSLGSQHSVDYTLYGELIHHSLVRKIFKELGYQFVSFKTPYPWVDIHDADNYIQESDIRLTANVLDSNDFDEMLNKTTAWRVVDEVQTISPYLVDKLSTIQYYLKQIAERLFKDVRSPDKMKYDIILNGLDKIENVSRLPGRKFVYLHVPAPHPPFVLGKQGEFVPTSDTISGYTNSITYLNQRVISIIKSLLTNSKTPPIIIVQGDHGWGPSEKTRTYILNAYYLPGDGAKKIYPTITPVNTFRTIFDTYFGGNFAILEDKSYFSPGSAELNFQLVPSNCAK